VPRREFPSWTVEKLIGTSEMYEDRAGTFPMVSGKVIDQVIPLSELVTWVTVGDESMFSIRPKVAATSEFDAVAEICPEYWVEALVSRATAKDHPAFIEQGGDGHVSGETVIDWISAWAVAEVVTVWTSSTLVAEVLTVWTSLAATKVEEVTVWISLVPGSVSHSTA